MDICIYMYLIKEIQYIFSFKKELSDAEKELLGKLQKEEDNVLATTYYSFRFKI